MIATILKSSSTFSAVRYNDTINRVLLVAHSEKSHFYHNKYLQSILKIFFLFFTAEAVVDDCNFRKC